MNVGLNRVESLLENDVCTVEIPTKWLLTIVVKTFSNFCKLFHFSIENVLVQVYGWEIVAFGSWSSNTPGPSTNLLCSSAPVTGNGLPLMVVQRTWHADTWMDQSETVWTSDNEPSCLGHVTQWYRTSLQPNISISVAALPWGTVAILIKQIFVIDFIWFYTL